jgi:phytoene desaturase
MKIPSVHELQPIPGTRDTPDAARLHAVVIGSGFGGLAAAIRLGARGYRVTVLEKLDAPGGRAYVYRDKGFTFDAGPTIVTAPFLFEELWHLCGKRLSDYVQLRPVSPFYRMRFDDGTMFDYTGDAQQMRAEVGRLSPSDVAGYERYMKISEATYKVGFEQLAHVSFDSFAKMAAIVPQMVKLQSYRTVYGLVSRYVKDEKLRTVLSFHPLLVGGNPFTTTSIYCLIAHLERQGGVHFAMGGTGKLVQGLVQLIEGQGNLLRCNAEVDSITLDGRRATGVKLKSGEIISADVVVSNADSAWTYQKLLPARARKRWTDANLARARYSMSLFVWYFGTRRQYPDIAHHTILLGPRYRELLQDIFEHKKLADDFSLYLHRPTATDPTLAPEGCDAFYVLSPVPHLASGTDWSTEAPRYQRALCDALEKTLLPGLSREIETSRWLTPQDFQDRLNSVQGAAFGLEPVLTQSAWFRPHNKSEDIDNLYLVGAGTHPGAGLPGVLSSARVLDSLIPHAAQFASGPKRAGSG